MKLYIPLTLSILMQIGCSSSDNEGSDSIGSWILTDYTLANGTERSVPDDIQNEGGVGIFAISNRVLTVVSGLCDSYEISYRLDNDVLSTTNPNFPEASCDGFFSDENNTERTNLVGSTFLNTQTLVAMSDDRLTVTTVQNETLVFEPAED